VISQRHARKIDGEPVLVVFRSGTALPLVVLTGIVFLIVISIGADSPGIARFALAAWIVGSVPILISRRRAAIFTTESFILRPVFGRPQKIPLKGIKRAWIQPSHTGEDVRLCIQLLVGGELYFDLPDMDAILYLLNKGAGRGLEATPYNLERAG
jgi:hypothetical protein